MKVRRLLLFVILCATLAASCATARTPVVKKFVLSETAGNNIRFLQRSLAVEFAFCAYGVETLETVEVRRIEVAEIYDATPLSVEYGVCISKRNLLGYGHSHTSASTLGCEMSPTDRNGVMDRKAPYVFVACEGGGIKHFSREALRREYAKVKRTAALLDYPP